MINGTGTMKRTLLFTLSGLLLSHSLFALSIVLPKQPSVTEKTAADELSKHLSEMTGKNVPVTSEAKPGPAPRIYVGNTALAGKQTFSPEAWKIEAKSKNILLLQGGDPRGILYAAWEFLERSGVIWMDEEYTCLPRKKEITWAEDWKVSGKPAFALRDIFAYQKELDRRGPHRLWKARNRLNMNCEVFSHLKDVAKFGQTPAFGSPGPCHTHAAYSKDWKGKETECYALDKNGKRLPPSPDQTRGQVCLTNPETVRLFAKKLREYIRTDRENGIHTNYYDVSMNDNNDECQCPGCQSAKKQYGSYGGVALYFTNKLAEEMEKDHPEIKLQMFAYHTSAAVPANIKAHKNVIVRIALMGAEFLGVETRDTARPLTHPNNKQDRDRFLGWSGIAAIAVWDYWIMYRNNGITLFHKAIAENIRRYRDWGAVEVFAECERPMTNLFYAMRLWLGARLLNDPDLNEKKEIARFMTAYYGENAARLMQELMDHIQKCSDSIPYSLSRMNLFGRPDLDRKFFRYADSLIEKALNAAETDLQKKHIRKERFALDYDNLTKFSGKAHPDMKLFKKRIVEDFELNAPLFMKTAEQKKLRNELDLLLAGSEVTIRPPVGFDAYEILHDITWPTLKITTRKVEFVDMPDAAAGKAFRTADSEKHFGVVFGLYDYGTKKNLATADIPLSKVYQDEKFHYYRLGKVTLTPQCLLWVHPSWRLNQNLGQFYSRILEEDNTCEIFVSLKAEGPRYSKGSRKPNAISLDRILLVHPKRK